MVRHINSLLKQLEHPNLKTIDLSLGRMEAYVAAFGHPQKRLPPVVHVAGTNGKGSVIAFLRAMLEAADYRCHIFTSPHLVHFCERIVVAGEQITETALIPILQTILSRVADYPLTFFEANTIAALEAFAANPADVTLLEVGLGGRFDATNIVEQPALTVITQLSLDHAEYLGDTLEQIAFEKAGIIKPGVPVVVAPQRPEAMAVIERVAAEKQAPVTVITEDQVEAMRHKTLSLPGTHQAVNAAVAKQCAVLLSLSDEPIERGLRTARWPARLQRLTKGPLAQSLPPHVALWLDGGHNAAAGQALADWAEKQSQPLVIICGMTKYKDPVAFLQPLKPLASDCYIVDIPDEPYAMTAQDVMGKLQQAGIAAQQAESVAIAVKKAAAAGAGSVLICGSLYLAGHVLAENG